MRPLVLFDIGGVQLHLNYGRFFERAAAVVSDIAEFKKEYSLLETEYFKRTDPAAGREFISRVKCNFVEKLSGSTQLSDNDTKELLASAWGGPIEEVLAVKARVREKYAVGNFSNLTRLHFEMLAERFQKILEGCLNYPSMYSCRTGATKAEPKIYRLIQDYSPVIFIDDNETYVRRAVSAGWKAILLTPYIDKSEAMRSAQNAVDTAELPAGAASTGDLKVADSVQSLEEAICGFGIKI